jgi:MAP/microtubule affinity-regulating kinase
VALKVYEKKNLKEEEMSTALRREIYILAALEHKNIVSIYEVINSRTHVHLVMELCEGKSLFHLIKKANEQKISGLPEKLVLIIFRQIIDAVSYMHSKSIVHRDLKLENILYNPLNHEIKIIDFGFAIKCD